MLGGLASLTVAARRKPDAVVAFGLATLALAAAACTGTQPVARAFGSMELEPIRDPSIFLDGQSGPGVIDYSTGGNYGTPQLWWTLDLTTGAVQSYGTSMPPPLAPPMGTSTTTTPPPPSSLYTCTQSYDSGDPPGTSTLEIVDTTTNVETDIHEVLTSSSCPGADGMLTAFVLNADGVIVLETGSYTQLAPVDLTVAVLAVLNWNVGATGTPASVTVLAAQVTSPDQEELDAIDLTTGYYEVTSVVPAVPASVAWATGATPVGSLQSNSLAGSASSVQFLDGHYLYPRSMSDGGTTMFVGPFASGPASELALFEIPPGTPLPMPVQLGVPKRSLVTWTLDGGAGAGGNTIAWDDTDLALAVCPSISNLYLEAVQSADGSKVLFEFPQEFGGYAGSGPLILLALGTPGGTASCQQLVGSGVVTAGFSPDSDFMFWVVQPATGELQPWVAGSDGSGARIIGPGEISQLHFIGYEGAELEMILDGELAWQDLHTTGTLHHVAEQVHGPIDDLSGAWLIMDYQWNATDATGTLALINRDDGQVRPISPSVTQYEVLSESLGADGGFVNPFGNAGVSSESVVVYVVQGRNPSAQDGIWRATITPAELP
jgi:hypothetical protein